MHTSHASNEISKVLILMSVIPRASCRIMDTSSLLFQTSLMRTAGFGYARG